MTDHGSKDPDVSARLQQLAGRDAYLNRLGITILEATRERVVLQMKVLEEHINFNGTCHGGVLFSFADTAFGLASNARGVIAAAVHADIAFCAAATRGEWLTAEAVEVSRSRRVGTYRVDVKSGETLVATFTGTVHVTERSHAA